MTLPLRALLLVGALLSPMPAFAAESPPETPAKMLLKDQELGPNYKVLSPVQGDALMRVYRLETPYGNFTVHGDALLQMRLRELAATRTLETMARSETFGKSLAQSAAAPLRFGANLITDPKETLTRSASGISNMFDRVGSGIRNSSSSRDNVAESLLGIEQAKRALAVQLGVDPYTTFPPLAQQLEEVGRAAGLGGLSMQALMMAIPGGAGLAVSSANSASNFNDALRTKTSSQLIDEVTATLQKLGVGQADINALVQNRVHSPAGLLLMARSLKTLNAKRSGLFIANAASAQTADEAFFQVQRADALTRNSAALGGIKSFVDAGGVPLNQLADGRVLALFPFDEFVWTDRVASLVAQVEASRPKGAALVFATDAKPTPMAAAELAKRGWTVTALPVPK